MERILGRKPTSVKGRLVEHKDVLRQGSGVSEWAEQKPKAV